MEIDDKLKGHSYENVSQLSGTWNKDLVRMRKVWYAIQ